jgi:hypothetical protein
MYMYVYIYIGFRDHNIGCKSTTSICIYIYIYVCVYLIIYVYTYIRSYMYIYLSYPNLPLFWPPHCFISLEFTSYHGLLIVCPVPITDKALVVLTPIYKIYIQIYMYIWYIYIYSPYYGQGCSRTYTYI